VRSGLCTRQSTNCVTAKGLTRRRALQRAFRLFEGNDAAAEIRRLKAQDAGF